MKKQRGPLFAVEVKGGLGSKELSRLVSLVFENQIDGFTYRRWSTSHVGIMHLSDKAELKADEGWRLDDDELFDADFMCERVLQQLAGQDSNVYEVRWRATTRWVGNDILLEVQLEPD